MILELALLAAIGLDREPSTTNAETRQRGDKPASTGKLESALAAYAAAWSGAPHDALAAYNAGTTALQLGRLPEAILWLRRAQAFAPEPDPWTEENLAAARRQLGHPEGTPSSPWSLVPHVAPGLAWMGAVLAWAALALGLLPGRRRLAWTALCAAVLLFAAGLALSRWGPREAVLLGPCPGLKLPPGHELWVLPGAESMRVLGPGGAGLCPAGALGLVGEP